MLSSEYAWKGDVIFPINIYTPIDLPTVSAWVRETALKEAARLAEILEQTSHLT